MQPGQGNLAPSRVFSTFFLLGPLLAAVLQLLLLNVLLLAIFEQNSHLAPPIADCSSCRLKQGDYGICDESALGSLRL
jgi:hypothetical protein